MPAFAANPFRRQPQYEVISPTNALDTIAAEYSGHPAKRAAAAAVAAPNANAAPRRPVQKLELRVREIADRVKHAVAEGLTPRRAVAHGAAVQAKPMANLRSRLRGLLSARAARGAMAPLPAALAVLGIMTAVIAVAIASTTFVVNGALVKGPLAPASSWANTLVDAGRAVIRNPSFVARSLILRPLAHGGAEAAAARNRLWFLGLKQPVWAPAPSALAASWVAVQALLGFALFAVLTRAAAPAMRRHGDARPSRFRLPTRAAAVASLAAALAIESVWGVFQRGLHSPAAGLAHACVFAAATIFAAVRCFAAVKSAGAAMALVAVFACAEVVRHAAIFRLN